MKWMQIMSAGTLSARKNEAPYKTSTLECYENKLLLLLGARRTFVPDQLALVRSHADY